MRGLGAHGGLNSLAMTKHEVCALLCQTGVDLDLHVVPEYDVFGSDRDYAIDVVWAMRSVTPGPPVWIPIAAFEVEGVGVTASLTKDAASLSVMSSLGAAILATVLFQVGPDAEPWKKSIKTMNTSKRSALGRAQARLKKELGQIGASSVTVDVLLDEDLPTFLTKYKPIAEKRRDDLRNSGTAHACR